MKKYILISIVLLCFFVLSGCSGNKEAEGKTKITFMFWGAPGEKTAVENYIKMFSKTHPDVYVDMVHKPAGQYSDVLQTMIAGNNAPDVMYVGMEYFPFYTSKGAFLNLDPVIAADTAFNINDFYPEVVKPFKYKENLYGIPKDCATLMLYYNKDLFDKAGVAYPNSNWTWKDFRNAAEKLTKDNNGDGKIDQYGFVVESWIGMWQPWVWQNGGEIMNQDNTKWVLGDPKYINQNVEALQFLWDMIFGAKPVAPEPSVTADRSTPELFKTGNVAMCAYGRWMCMDFKDIKHFKWDMAPLPQNKKKATSLFTVCYAVSAKTKHQKESWELVKYLTGPDGQIAIAEAGHAIPSMIKYGESDHFLKAPVLPTNLNNRANLDGIPYARPIPCNPAFKEMDAVMTRDLQLMWNGKMKPREAVTALQPKMEKILKDNNIQ